MTDFFNTSVVLLWTALWVLWLSIAVATKPTVQTQSRGSRFVQQVPVILAYFLLFGRGIWPYWLHQRVFLKSEMAFQWLGLALTVTGIAFAIWARLWIGKTGARMSRSKSTTS